MDLMPCLKRFFLAVLGRKKEASEKAMAVIHSRDGSGLDEGGSCGLIRNAENQNIF